MLLKFILTIGYVLFFELFIKHECSHTQRPAVFGDCPHDLLRQAVWRLYIYVDLRPVHRREVADDFLNESLHVPPDVCGVKLRRHIEVRVFRSFGRGVRVLVDGWSVVNTRLWISID